MIQFSSIAPPARPGRPAGVPVDGLEPAGREPRSSGTLAPARASRAACTPAAAASPTWSDLPSEPKAARSPPARSRARAAAERCIRLEAEQPAAATAAPTAPHTAVGCQPRSYSVGVRGGGERAHRLEAGREGVEHLPVAAELGRRAPGRPGRSAR